MSRWARRATTASAIPITDSARRSNLVYAALSLVLALTGLVGHAYGASALYGLNRWGGTAVSTATGERVTAGTNPALPESSVPGGGAIARTVSGEL